MESDKIRSKYENGKIYTIRSNQSDKYYIGSTCSPLNKRLYEHKRSYKRYLDGKLKMKTASYEIVKFDDAYIELLELFPCQTKIELIKREGELIRQHKHEVTNVTVPLIIKIKYKSVINYGTMKIKIK
jgi:hypothetical protein